MSHAPGSPDIGPTTDHYELEALKKSLANLAIESYVQGYAKYSRDMIEEVEQTVTDPQWAETVRMNENAWNEIQSAYLFKRALLTLIAQYKAEGYLAATLDKFAQLVENGHDGWSYGDE